MLCCFASEFKRRIQSCKHPSCLYLTQFCFPSIQKEVKVVSVPFVFHFVLLGTKRKQKLQTSFTNTECLYTFARNEACDPPYLVWLVWSQETSMLLLPSWALFDWVFDLVLVYCFFLKPCIIDYLGSFDTNYIIFRNVEKSL